MESLFENKNEIINNKENDIERVIKDSRTNTKTRNIVSFD